MNIKYFIKQFVLYLFGALAIISFTMLGGSSDDTPVKYYIFLGIVFTVSTAITIIIVDWYEVYRVLISIGICMGAFTYAVARPHNKVLRKCYKIKKSAGSYKACYGLCSDVYDRYMEDKESDV